MTQQPPQPLDYRSPGDPSRVTGRHKFLKFMIGVVAGVTVSAMVWTVGWERYAEHGSGAALWVVPSGKILVAVPLLFVPRWRLLGVGLLISIPLGGLIFLGSCFANFRYR